jgi:hypothetical protein
MIAFLQLSRIEQNNAFKAASSRVTAPHEADPRG